MVWFWVFIAYISLNFIMFVSMVFFERRKLSSVISWLTIFTILPIVGYLFYAVFGSGLSIRVRRMISKHKLYQVEYDQEIREHILGTNEEETLQRLKDDAGIVKCCYNYGSILCPDNDVKIFRWGEEKSKRRKKASRLNLYMTLLEGFTRHADFLGN